MSSRKSAQPVVAVTRYGALRFDTVEAALASKAVDLIEPIFVHDGPIDRTLIKGPGLGEFTGDAWAYLLEHSKPYVPPVIEPKIKARRGRKSKSE